MKQILNLVLALTITSSFAQTALWQQQISGTANTLKGVDFIDFQTAFAVGDNGTALRTVDAGYNWTSMTLGITDALTDVSFVDLSVGWITGSNSIVYKTTNGGDDWIAVTTPLTDTYNTVFCIDENTAWIGCDNNQTILYTTNQGADWGEATAQGGHVNDIFFISLTKGWYASNVGIYTTDDGGVSWVNQKYTGAGVNGNSIHFVDNLNGWYTTSDGKIWNTTDGGANWNMQTSGVGSTVSISAINFIDANIGVAVTQDHKILNTINGGVNWEIDELTADVPLFDIEMFDENTIYTVGVEGKIYRKQQHQEICMVFVDDVTGMNQIVWEKIYGQGTALYRIYKLDGASFVQIHEQNFDDMTETIDWTSQPNVMSAQYKVSTVDALGNESDLSPYHETINLSTSQGVPTTTAVLQWNHYVDESGNYAPDYYYIYRGTESTNMTLYDQVSSANISFNDADGASPHFYKIVVEKADGCVPESAGKASGGPYYQSSSNIEDEGIVSTSINNQIVNSNIKIYPNPTTGKVLIEAEQFVSVEVYNLSGILIKSTDKQEIDLSQEAKGIYFVKVTSSDFVSIQKLILE